MIAISGGTHSGKTTCVSALATHGYTIVPEAAIAVIGELNKRLGVEPQRRWRQRHPLEFQMMVSRKQAENEAQVKQRASGTAVFCDRGLPDGIAYCVFNGLEPPAELLELVHGHPYEMAFVLETIPTFDRRLETGRASSLADSRRLFDLCLDAYRSVGCRVHVVPVCPVADRVAMILNDLGLARRP